jgi:hypothetical protein
VNRRLRLVLFVAALLAAGPAPSGWTIEVARAAVTIGWFHGDQDCCEQTRPTRTAIPAGAFERVAFGVRGDHVLPRSFHSYSLFQRPPPLHD